MQARLDEIVVIFDLDGTLIDTAADLAAAMNHALEIAGRPAIEMARVRHLVGRGARAMLAEGYALSGPPPSDAALDRSLQHFLDHYYGHIADHSRPFPHVVEEIGNLREAGARIAICTNKREKPARMLIEALGLTGLFSEIVGMDTASAPKPDPAPAELCLRLTGRQRALFVGDSDTDILTAKAAGMPSLIATFGYGPVSHAASATALFDSYEGLANLVADTLSSARA